MWIEGDTDADLSSALAATSAAGEEKLTDEKNGCRERVAQVGGPSGHAAVQNAGAASPANSTILVRARASDDVHVRWAGRRESGYLVRYILIVHSTRAD